MKEAAESGPHGKMRLALLTSLVKFDEICKENGRFFNAADLETLQSSAESAMVCFNALAVEAVMNHRLLWQVKPKAHMFTHMVSPFPWLKTDGRAPFPMGGRPHGQAGGGADRRTGGRAVDRSNVVLNFSRYLVNFFDI